ncbi:MAG: DUF2203 domain-containing protein [Acidobacteriia bacterium]|jgi:hypothetical protein|nr:DUF2203 domain-containing protein [Terriglobia bacterium]
MADRYFKREEAEELLPLIDHCLRQARDSKERVEGLDRELAQASARIMALGGSLPAYRKLVATREQREKLVAQLQEAMNQIQETGCLVKDLDEGLVDFPTLREGEEVYLCWKLGEERIGYWHGVEEGFAGRKPLEDETRDGPPSGSQRVQ